MMRRLEMLRQKYYKENIEGVGFVWHLWLSKVELL